MTREVMLICKQLRESDLPLMTRAVEMGKRCGEFFVCELFDENERKQAVEAMKISRMFEWEYRKVGEGRGRPRLVAVWRG